MSDTMDSSRLHVLQAIADGWRAFAKSPWTFLLFQAISTLLALPFAICAVVAGSHVVIQTGDFPEIEGLTFLHPTGATFLLIFGLIGYAIAILWCIVGLTRGAWSAMEGRKPQFSTFTRWDSRATGRLLLNWIVISLMFAVIALVSLFSIGLATNINQALAIIPAIAGLAAYTYMAINQKFWIQASLLKQENPFGNIQRSRAKVDPSWGWVALFAIAEFIIHAIATGFYLGGLFVIFPVIVCISTAAYRQLFGTADQTGFLSEH